MGCFEQTVELIKKAGVPYREIAEHCGVTKGWVSQVVRGVIKEPSIVKIERINEFLKSEMRREKKRNANKGTD